MRGKLSLMIDFDKFNELARREDWHALHAMLDDARARAITADDVRREVYWRVAALRQQGHYQEAFDLLREKEHTSNSKCRMHHGLARLLLKLGRDQEAIDELSKAPFEAEMTSFYGLATDAKFLYLYLLAKQGDSSVRGRLNEIPGDYEYVTTDVEFLTKADIVALLKGPDIELP